MLATTTSERKLSAIAIVYAVIAYDNRILMKIHYEILTFTDFSFSFSPLLGLGVLY